MKTITYPLWKEEYTQFSLKNGLNVYLIPKKNFTTYHAILGVQYGNIDLHFHFQGKSFQLPSGTAHFLEHQIFKLENGQDALTLFAQQNGDANAYTTYDSTAYLFSCTENFFPNLQLLLQFVHSPHFHEKNVQQEKKIITEEIQMEKNSPHWQAYHQTLQALFHQHPLKEDIAGTPESIQLITPQTLQTAYQAFYQPSNMTLVCCGNLQAQKLHNFLENFYLSQPLPTSPPPQRLYPNEPPHPAKTNVSSSMPLSRPYLLLATKEILPPHTNLSKIELTTQIALELLFGKSQPFREQLVQECNIDDSFSYSFHTCQNIAFTLIGGECSSPKKLASLCLKQILSNPQQLLQSNDFQRLKNKTIGRFLTQWDYPEYITHEFLHHILQGTIYFDTYQTLTNLTLQEVQKRLANLQKQTFITSLLQPKSP